MATITALKAQKNRSDRLSVFLDGEFAFGLPRSVAAELRVGQTLSAEQISALQTADIRDKARRYVFQLLSRRPRSIAEIRRKLKDKEYSEDVARQVIAELTEKGLLDDIAFARYWIEQRETFKPRSRMALQYELRQKGVSLDAIETALSGFDETAAARRAAVHQARRLKNLPEQAFRAKLGAYLQRRGFGYEIIREISDEMWQAVCETTT
ncbi:MAG: regulatory protein RecX [Anaerolineae bacterium]